MHLVKFCDKMNNHGWASRRGGGERPGVRRTRACTTNREVRHVGMSSTPVAMSCMGPRRTGTSLRHARVASRTNMSASHWVLHPGTRVPRVMIDARSGASRAPIWFAMGGRAWPPALVGDHWSQASARFWAGTWHGWRVDLGPWAELHACP